MLIKTIKIFFFVGASNLLNFFVVSYLIKNRAPISFINELAFFESSFSFALAAISFGYTQIISRDLVVKKNWKSILYTGQSARFAFSITISFIGVILSILTKDIFYALIISPFIALNVLFALYSKGKPLYASKLSFYRVLIPAIALIFIDFLDVYYIVIYVVSQIAAMVLIGFLSSKELNIKYLTTPIFNNIREYTNNFLMGLTDLAISILQLGVLFIAGFFYEKDIVGNSYLILKIYVLFKGVSRVIFQIFYHQLYRKEVILLSEKTISLAGMIFFILLFFYPTELILLFFTENYLENIYLIQIIGFAGLISSLHISSTASFLLRKKDKEYIFSYMFAIAFLLLGLFIIYYTNYYSYGIIISLFIGELCLLLSVFYFMRDIIGFSERVSILFPLVIIITISTISHWLIDYLLINILIDSILIGLYLIWFYDKNRITLKQIGLNIN